MTLICTVYRSSREPELYLYVARADALTRVPEELLKRIGTAVEVLTMKLTPDRKLARAKAPQVLAAIAEKGYYLQLPPDIHAASFSLGGG
jgi:uncharacterized protein YcgL (UPF0745 family)